MAPGQFVEAKLEGPAHALALQTHAAPCQPLQHEPTALGTERTAEPEITQSAVEREVVIGGL